MTILARAKTPAFSLTGLFPCKDANELPAETGRAARAPAGRVCARNPGVENSILGSVPAGSVPAEAVMIIQNSLETVECGLSAVGGRLRSALRENPSELWERLATVWCKTFHDSLMWPSHGRYECAKCHRIHPVSWDEGALRRR